MDEYIAYYSTHYIVLSIFILDAMSSGFVVTMFFVEGNDIQRKPNMVKLYIPITLLIFGFLIINYYGFAH